jgi:hypothetical protein
VSVGGEVVAVERIDEGVSSLGDLVDDPWRVRCGWIDLIGDIDELGVGDGGLPGEGHVGVSGGSDELSAEIMLRFSGMANEKMRI